MPKYYYSSVAAPAKLQAMINSTQTNSIILSASTGLPGSFPFKLTIDPDGTLEVIKVNTMSGTTITDCVRGVDGTTATAHDTGVDVVHDSSAEDFADPNDHIYGSQLAGTARHPATTISVSPTGNIASTNVQDALAEVDSEKAAKTHTHAESDVTNLASDLSGKVAASLLGAKGSLIGAGAASSPLEIPVGTNGQVLTVDSGMSAGVKWATPVSSKALIPGFAYASSASSAGPAPMQRWDGSSTGSQIPVVMDRSGSIVGIGASTNGAPSAGTVSFEVYKNGVATGLSVAVGVGGSTAVSTQAAGLDTFTAGDKLTVYFTRTGASGAISGEATITVQYS